MPKKEVEKNKKISTNKVQPKKIQPKKVNKKVEVKEVETKKVEKEVVLKGKDNKKRLVDNTPFVVMTCIALILLATLIFSIVYKRVPTTKDGNEIIATIKGKTITADDLYKSLKNENGTNTLINMIDEYISEKEVKIDEDDEEYVESVVDYYKDYAKQYDTDLATFLTNYVGLSGIETEKEFYNFVMKDYKKSLAVVQYIGDQASEKELKEYYKENYSDKQTVKHILIQLDAEEEDTEKADKEAYERALEVIEKLNKVDKDKLDKKFEEYAKEYSEDTETYKNGGLIEKFQKSEVEEEFYNASAELKNGKYTKEPVKTSYGYHIILKVDSEKVESFEKIKDKVKEDYANAKLSEDSTLQVSSWDKLRNEYKLKINDDIIKAEYNKTIKDNTTEKETEKTEE